MEAIDIVKKIIGILDLPERKPKRLYTASPPSFSQKQAELLLRLESQIDNLESKKFFWGIIGSPLLSRHLKFPASKAFPDQIVLKAIYVVNRNCAICLIAYIKANKIDEALDGLIGKWGTKYASLNSVESETVQFLSEIFENEAYLFDSDQLEKIEKCIEFCRSMLTDYRIKMGPGTPHVSGWQRIDHYL